MSRSKELVKNTAIVAIGRFCTKFLSFFLLPFYTAVLSTEDYGTVDLFHTYSALIFPIIVFQITDALFRFCIDVRGNEIEKKKVASTVIVFCAFQSVIFTVLFVGAQVLISSQYKWFLLGNVLVSVFSSALLQLTRGLGHNDIYALSSFLNALTAIILNIVLVLLMNMGAKGLFWATLVANGISIIYIVVKENVCHIVRVRWFERKLLKCMLEYSLPLVPNNLAWWIIGASDKTIVSCFLGMSQNGILSVSQKFSTMFTTFYGIFNLTWTENATVYSKEKDREKYYSYIIDTSFRVLAAICMGIIAIVAIVFPWIINEKFADSYYQIPIYMLSALFYSTIGIYSVVYIANKKTGEVAKTSVIAALINVIVNVVLIRFIGLYAASISSVIAYGILFLIRYLDIKKHVRIKMNKRMVMSVVVCMTINFVVYYIRNLWLSICNLMITVLYVIYINRKLIYNLIVFVKDKMEMREM